MAKLSRSRNLDIEQTSILIRQRRSPISAQGNALGRLLRNHDCETRIVGGVADHVHALFTLSRNYSIATIVKEIKRASSGWVKDVSPQLRKFHWQNGYGAFSVSQSDLGRVISYIERQEEHHRRVTFKDEFRAFLKSYEIECDERYVWD